MQNSNVKYIGLDVHKEAITISIASKNCVAGG
jgi:hypothetical protein